MQMKKIKKYSEKVKDLDGTQRMIIAATEDQLHTTN